MDEIDRRGYQGVYDEDRLHRDLQNGIGAEGPDTRQDLLGSDLRVASVAELEADSQRQLLELRKQKELRIEDIDPTLLDQTRYIQKVYDAEMVSFQKDHHSIATKLQDLVIEELRRRENQRDVPHSQGSFESYQEDLVVIDQLAIELAADRDALPFDEEYYDNYDEAQLAIDYLQVWNKDITAELTVEEVKRLYSLAA